MTANLPINLHDLLRQRTIEGERVEYKAGWNPQSVLHTKCAFANDFHDLSGGYVVFGVEERDGQPSLPPRGVDPGRIESLQNELLRLGQSAIQPHYHPLSGVSEVEGRTILVLWAPGGETRPPSCQSHSGKRGDRVGVLHSPAQQHGPRQRSRRTRTAVPGRHGAVR